MTDHQKETKKTCNHIMHNQKPCGRDKTNDDSEHCIFHSNDIEGKKTEFNHKFWQEIERRKEQEYDFTGFVFPGDISFERINFKKNVYFHGARFHGIANFGSAIFSGNVYFGGARFFKKANFDRTQFTGDAFWGDVHFSGNVSFWDAPFTGTADFGNARFSEKADFRQTQFFKKTDFMETQFMKKAEFWGTKFSGDTYFGKAHFLEEVGFGDSQFFEKASFAETKFSKEANFSKVIFSNQVVFTDARFMEKASFWQTRFTKKANFGKAQFNREASFVGAQFLGETHFNHSKFNETAYFEDAYFHNAANCFMEESYFDDISGLLEFIEQNKKNFKYTHKTEFLPDHFRLILGEKAAAKYPIISKKIRDDMFLLSFKKRHPHLHFFWWLFADCGRSFSKWAVWCLIMAFFFGFLYQLFGPGSFKPKPEGYTWFTFYYYSFVTFTTLGFGDITPIKWYTEILVTLEVIVGYGMLGGLISILANKLARRS